MSGGRKSKSCGKGRGRKTLVKSKRAEASSSDDACDKSRKAARVRFQNRGILRDRRPSESRKSVNRLCKKAHLKRKSVNHHFKKAHKKRHGIGHHCKEALRKRKSLNHHCKEAHQKRKSIYHHSFSRPEVLRGIRRSSRRLLKKQLCSKKTKPAAAAAPRVRGSVKSKERLLKQNPSRPRSIASKSSQYTGSEAAKIVAKKFQTRRGGRSRVEMNTTNSSEYTDCSGSESDSSDEGNHYTYDEYDTTFTDYDDESPLKSECDVEKKQRSISNRYRPMQPSMRGSVSERSTNKSIHSGSTAYKSVPRRFKDQPSTSRCTNTSSIDFGDCLETDNETEDEARHQCSGEDRLTEEDEHHQNCFKNTQFVNYDEEYNTSVPSVDDDNSLQTMYNTTFNAYGDRCPSVSQRTVETDDSQQTLNNAPYVFRDKFPFTPKLSQTIVEEDMQCDSNEDIHPSEGMQSNEDLQLSEDMDSSEDLLLSEGMQSSEDLQQNEETRKY